MRATPIFAAILLLAPVAACKKDASAANDVRSGLECDHDIRIGAVAKHAWPYPAEYRNLRWTGDYAMYELRVRPTPAAFITATVGFRAGDVIEVLDSHVQIYKPRRLVAKRDLYVTRTVWNQGVEVEQSELAVAKGEVGSFLFYNSQGMCIIATNGEPAWTPCTLDDAFEGLSADSPYACEEEWWVQLQKRRIDKGWMVIDPTQVERLAPPPTAAK
jgi:hypothetical protein